MINQTNLNKKTRNHIFRMEIFDFMYEYGCFYERAKKGYLVLELVALESSSSMETFAS